MPSSKHGRRTSTVEVTNVSRKGVWLLVGDVEMFMSFDDFPWFEDASIRAIMNVERPSAGHLYWPDLDIDLAEESLVAPERFPLVSKLRAGKSSLGPKTRRPPKR